MTLSPWHAAKALRASFANVELRLTQGGLTVATYEEWQRHADGTATGRLSGAARGEIMKPAEECATLAEVREAIDTLDRELLALLGRRAGYVHAAARFKTDVASVRAPERVRAMLEQPYQATGPPPGI